jgi:hypothetical protein
LVIASEVPRVARAHVGALEVPHENLHEGSPVVDTTGQDVLQQALAKLARNMGRLWMMKRSSSMLPN